MKKASYTDRPLTKEEKIFAEKHHDLMYRYMRVHKLDLVEWYDILIIPYLQAVKKYHEYERLQSLKFEQVFFRTLDNARSNYWRDMNRKKRCPEGGIWSYEGLRSAIYNEENGEEDILDRLQDISTCLAMENIISDSMDVKNMINELKQYRQKEIVYLLLDGYCGVEIQKILRMSLQSYTKAIGEIRKTLEGLI